MTIDHGPAFHYADVRYVATGGLNAVTPSWLRISMNPARGDGGTCYGDSGGPNFLGAGGGETNIVAGTTITGDSMCRATNVDYRMDTLRAGLPRAVRHAALARETPDGRPYGGSGAPALFLSGILPRP